MSALEKLIHNAAVEVAKTNPQELSQAIPLLDRHLVSQPDTELWICWCSVRQAVMWQKKGRP